VREECASLRKKVKDYQNRFARIATQAQGNSSLLEVGSNLKTDEDEGSSLHFDKLYNNDKVITRIEDLIKEQNRELDKKKEEKVKVDDEFREISEQVKGLDN
jgi:hypothetical protein